MKNKYDKFWHRLALSASVSFFLTFTLVLYGPIKLYIENKDILWFTFNATLNIALILSAIVFVILTLIALIPKRFIHAGICCLLFALALGLFIQGNFLNIGYGSGVIDGSEIAWKDYTTHGAINSAIWAACLAMPFALYMVFRVRWRNIVMYSSLALILVQVVMISVVIYQNRNSLEKITYEVTTDGIYELSEDDNTIVFLLDAFDEEYFKKIKRDFPDYEQRLSGFTEYDNALSAGSGAAIALPATLTGEVYTRDTTYDQYIESIWDNGTVYSLLSDNNIDTRVFAQTRYFDKGAKDDIENIVDYMDTTGTKISLTSTIYKYTAYTFAPHYLKKYFWIDLDTISTYKSNNAYSINDAKFYSDYVRNSGFNYTDEYKNSVRIYNLNGAKPPYTLTKGTIKSINGSTLDDQVYGCFNCLFAMIDDLKTNGVYDDATIIITANVGNKSMAQNPVLLIKQSGAAQGYEISHAPVSGFDLAPTLASIVTDDYINYGSGKSYFDLESDDERTRNFYYNTGANSDVKIEKYIQRGDSSSNETFKLINSYYPLAKKVNYKLGTSLTFAMDATANMYCTEGFCATTGWRTSMAGPKSQMVIPLESVPQDKTDIHVFFGIQSIDKITNCAIYANGNLVFSDKVDKSYVKDGLNFTIPISSIGENNKIILDFVFSEIPTSEYELDQSERTKTIAFETFKLYTQ